MVMKSPNERLRANAGANQQIGGYGGSSMPSAAPFHSMVGQFEMAEKLKGASMDYLKKYVRNPSGNIPLYMVMAELQRRVDGQKRAQMADAAAKQQRPTVAQQVLDQVGSAPQEAGIPGAVTAFEQAQDAQRMASQTMAARSGGVIKFQNRGFVQSPFYYQELQRELDTLLAQPENLQPKPRIKQIYEELSTNPAAQTAGDVRRIDRQIDRENLGTMDYSSAAPPSPPPDQRNYQSMLDYARGTLPKTQAVTDAENRAITEGMASNMLPQQTDAYRAALAAEERKKQEDRAKEDQKITEGMASNMLPPSLNERDQRKLNSKLLAKLKVIDRQERSLRKLKNKESKRAKDLRKNIDANLADVAKIREQGGFISDEVLAEREKEFRRIERGDPKLSPRGRKSTIFGEGTEERDARLALEAQDDRTTFPVVPKGSKADEVLASAQQYMDPIIVGETETGTDAPKKVKRTEEVDTNIAAEPETEAGTVKVPTVDDQTTTIDSDSAKVRDRLAQSLLGNNPNAIIKGDGAIQFSEDKSISEQITNLIKDLKNTKPTAIEAAAKTEGMKSPFEDYRKFLDEQGLNRKKQDKFLDQMPLFNAALTALASNDPNVLRTMAAAGKSYLDTAMNIGERKRQLDNENAKTRFLLGQAESEFQRGERDFAFRLQQEANTQAYRNRATEVSLLVELGKLRDRKETRADRKLEREKLQYNQDRNFELNRIRLNEMIKSREATAALRKAIKTQEYRGNRREALQDYLGTSAAMQAENEALEKLKEANKNKLYTDGFWSRLFGGKKEGQVTENDLRKFARQHIESEFLAEYDQYMRGDK